MLFRKSKPAAQAHITPESVEPSGVSPNGPDTIVMDTLRVATVIASTRWRRPGCDKRREQELERALLILERTAACTDLALERLAEVSASLEIGQRERTYLMRGLMMARIEEVLESLVDLAKMAAHDGVNLLGTNTSGLKVSLEAGDFNYSLAPVCIHRDRTGLNIPLMTGAFEDGEETGRVVASVARGQRRLQAFAARLSGDADVIIGLLQRLRDKTAEVTEENAQREATLAALRNRSKPSEQHETVIA
jgi:hypothetical protein